MSEVFVDDCLKTAIIGKEKRLTGVLLDQMQIEANGRLAVLYLDDEILRRTGTSRDDTEGLVNLPFAARDVHAVVFC